MKLNVIISFISTFMQRKTKSVYYRPSGTVVRIPAVLCFTADASFSSARDLRALKLCHAVGRLLSFIIHVDKFGRASPT